LDFLWKSLDFLRKSGSQTGWASLPKEGSESIPEVFTKLAFIKQKHSEMERFVEALKVGTGTNRSVDQRLRVGVKG
jgi:hypothetical protein